MSIEAFVETRGVLIDIVYRPALYNCSMQESSKAPIVWITPPTVRLTFDTTDRRGSFFQRLWRVPVDEAEQMSNALSTPGSQT